MAMDADGVVFLVVGAPGGVGCWPSDVGLTIEYECRHVHGSLARRVQHARLDLQVRTKSDFKGGP